MPCKRKTEVYSRAVGYYRPVQQWNKGKVAEFHNRLMFKVVGAPAVPLVSRKSDGVRPRGAGGITAGGGCATPSQTNPQSPTPNPDEARDA